jgi:hypothetical protein
MNASLGISATASWFALALMAFATSCATAPVPTCGFAVLPEVLRSQGQPQEIGSELVQVWDFQDDARLWTQTAPPSIAAFRQNTLAGGIDVDPSALLRREGELSNASIRRNNQVVETHAAAWIRPARCIELLLLEQQYQRIDPTRRSTEFAALILRRDRDWRVYQITQNTDGIRNAGILFEALARDVAAGWTLEASLHNHNLAPDRNTPRGAIAPSESDAAMNAMMNARFGMHEAWITNGFHTVRIPSASFALFLAPPTQ